MATSVTAPSGERTLDPIGQKLVVEGARLLAEEGPAALTVRRISAGAGVSTMCLYDRFGDKNGVIEELFVEGFQSLGEALTRAVGRRASIDDADPVECLLEGALTYRRWALRNRTQYGVMFSRAVPDFLPSARALDTSCSTLAILQAGVAAAVEAGRLGPAGVDPDAVAHMLWATMHGLVSLELAGLRRGVGPSPSRHFEAAMRAMLRGLAP
jgi:AcrR family transcriptional regulator